MWRLHGNYVVTSTLASTTVTANRHPSKAAYDQIQARKMKARLRMLQHAQRVSGNVSQTCRFFGVSRALYYIWKARYDKHGVAGLRDMPRRPHKIRFHIPPEIVSLILRIREERRYGAVRVSLYNAAALSRLRLTDDDPEDISPPSRWPCFTKEVPPRPKTSGCTSAGTGPLCSTGCEVRSSNRTGSPEVATASVSQTRSPVSIFKHRNWP